MKIVAHRGYSGKYPELSPIAVDKALELPIHGVEIDVRLTRDGRTVVHHDATLDRTSTMRGAVSKMDWAEIKNAEIGGPEFPGQHPMLLDEVLERFQDPAHRDKHLFIETKHSALRGSEIDEQVILRLRYAGLHEDPRMHIISFNHSAMRTLRRLAPETDRFYLRREWERRLNPRDFLLSRPTGLGMSLLRAKLRPGDIGAKGLPTYLWTVNDADDIAWAAERGVKIVATDEPEVALRALGER